MEWYWYLALAGLVMVLLRLNGAVRGRRRMRRYAAMASQWTRDEAEAAYKESYVAACTHLTSETSLRLSYDEVMEHLERAAAAATRVQQLLGRDHGPAFRRIFLRQLVKSITAEAERQSQPPQRPPGWD
jgi:hypothetical protein